VNARVGLAEVVDEIVLSDAPVLVSADWQRRKTIMRS
jgi:hypothetical protein